jgi:hypothetical protein
MFPGCRTLMTSSELGHDRPALGSDLG